MNRAKKKLRYTKGPPAVAPQTAKDAPLLASNIINEKYTISCGDNLDVLPNLPPNSVDLTITSPPYFQQREYSSSGQGNENTIDEYLDNIIATLREVIRVTKPTGNIVYNIGDKIIAGSLQLIPYQFALRTVGELGLRLVNDVTWIKQNPAPHQFTRRLTNSTEPFFHFALSANYYHNRTAFQPSKERPQRRAPTNKLGSRYRKLLKTASLNPKERAIAHTALDQVIAEVHSGAIHSFRMKIRGIHAPAYGGQAGGRKMHIDRDGFTIIRISGQPMKRDVIESPVENLSGNGHPAIFPVRIIREMIRLLCPPKGSVLDPYLGSGSTMVAASIEDRSCIGIDISPSYCAAALERISQKPGQPKFL